MKKPIIIIFCLAFIGSGLLTYTYKSVSKGRVPAAVNSEWGTYLKEQAEAFKDDSGFYAKGIYNKLNDDRTWEGEDWGCMKRLKNFAYSQISPNSRPGGSHKFGFEIPDKEYQDARSNREDYQLPARILKDLDGSDPEFWVKQKWKKWDTYSSDTEKWFALQYRSRTVLNPGGYPQSLNRVLVLRQVRRANVEFDQWIQFTVSEPSRNEVNRASASLSVHKPFDPVGTDKQKLVDFISVRIKDKESDRQDRVFYKETGRYQKPLLSFRQFWRNHNGFKPKDRLAVGQGADTCYSCHANGMRSISPHPGSVWNKRLSGASRLSQGQMLTYFNDQIKLYGEVSWGKAIHPSWYGPGFGEKIGCTTCHDGYAKGGIKEWSRGAINWAFSSGHTVHKMSADATMPVNERGAHGLVKKILKKVISGDKDGVGGDTARKAHHKWINESKDGSHPGLLDSVKTLNQLSMLGGDKYDRAIAASTYAQEVNSKYKKYLFNFRDEYGQRYRKQTSEWLLEACDQNDD
jgi:hypothetical protein